MEHEKKADDRTLLRLAQGGDRIALRQLMSRYNGAIVKAVRDVLGKYLAGDVDVNDVAQDATQEVLLTLMDNLGDCDLDGVGTSFLAWASTLARNKTLDYIKYLTADKRSPRRVQSPPMEAEEQGDWLAQQAARLTSASGIVSRAELVGWMRAKLESLRPIDREVLELCDLQGKSVEEAKVILNISAAAVCMRRNRARSNLAILLETSLHKYLSSNRISNAREERG